jgi:parallel beta-helix repeat protein
VIDKKLNLIGNGTSNTIIDGNENGNVFEIKSDNVNITGFYITGSGPSKFNFYYAGIHMKGIENCKISYTNCSNNYIGIFINSSKNNSIENNICIKNDYAGILLGWGNTSKIKIINNICNYNYYGILLWDADNNTIKDNKCCFNKEIGLRMVSIPFISTNGNNLIENNYFDSNKESGIILHSSFNTIINNTCNSNIEVGIGISGSKSNIIKGNYISNNINGFIIKRNFTNNSIFENIISNNKQAGISIIPHKNEIPKNNTIFYNVMINNSQQANDNGTNNKWNTSSEGNYWSDWLSPDNDKNNIVDKPYNIPGNAKIKDYYPLAKIPIEIDYPPKIKTSDIIIAIVNRLYIVNYSANDFDTLKNNLIWTMKTNAHWLNFSNNQKLSGTPVYSNQSPIWVYIEVSDGKSCDSTNFTIRIIKSSQFSIFNLRTGQGFAEIQDAIDNAKSGDIIRVWAGTYSGGIDINKKISLIGNSSNDTMIVARFNNMDIDENYLIHINTDNCNISNFLLDGKKQDNDIDLGILISSNFNNIRCCEFRRNNWGTKISYKNNNSINNCIYTKSKFGGVRIMDSENNTIRNITIKNNNQCGILLGESSFNTIKESNISNNNVGIDLSGSNNNIIFNCDIENNTYYGIGFSGSKNQICKNNIKNNRIGIIIIASRFSFINNNTLMRNSENGIKIISSYSKSNLISNNLFIGNSKGKTQAFDNGTNNYWNTSLHGNYWSDWTTPDNNNDGIVDIPYNITGNAKTKDYYPLTKPILDISVLRKNINIYLSLNENNFYLNQTITGKFEIHNNNFFDFYTSSSTNFEKNITISPNILFKIHDQNSTQKYFSWDTQLLKIPAKSIQSFNFSLSGFNTIKDLTGNQFKLPPGNYSIRSTFTIYIDSNFYFNISSNEEYLGVINETPGQVDNATPSIENITITLNLAKQKYQLGEPISGNVNILFEMGEFDFEKASKTHFDFGHKFVIESIESSKKYYSGPKINFYSLIDLQKSINFNFSLIEYSFFTVPITQNPENISDSNLSVGNYTISCFLFDVKSLNNQTIESNNVTFQIVENKSIYEIKENIFIQLFLNKSKYEIYETITGTVTIFNNNSFDIILNDPLYQKLFGVFYGIYSLDNDNYSSIFDKHYEVSIDYLKKYQIKAKNSIEIKFKLEKYVKAKFHVQTRSTPEGNWTYHYFSNLPAGKYYIAAYIYDFDMPDYELEVIDDYKVLSKIVKFSIIEEFPDEIANISIKLQLSKSIYEINESIIGTINISNKNTFNVALEKNILLQRLTGEHFEINSIDALNSYGAFINDVIYPIMVKAQNYTIIDFKIDQVFKLPLRSKNITYTDLSPGNYSIFAFFYYGNFTNFTKLRSNIVTFRIIENISNSGSGPWPLGPPKGDNKKGSFKSLFFFSSIGVIVIIILITTAFVGGTEVGKYGFFSAIAPLYTKRRRKKDENYGYNKGLIQGYVDGNPGESYNSIKRALDLKNGTLAYYLKVLQREGIIKSERDGMYKRFYPTKGKSSKEVIELSSIQQKIFGYIRKNPGCSQTDISNKLGLIQSKINYHVNLMVDARVIKIKHDSNKTMCYILEEVS